jgi:hypothetical protein
MKWELEDSARLREYHTKSGGKMLAYLRSRIPACDGKTIEEVALQAKYKEGYERLIVEIEDLIDNQESPNSPETGSFTAM